MTNLHWWQSAVFYQIYPRSFADGNGDGIGDLGGMIAKLDYLQDLGIDALWLSPHYPSPQFDVGYDISDYTDVAPEYGTLADFRRFLEQAHRRDLRVVLDLVLNHTSHLHRWFQQSRSGRDNPLRDWYVWRDGRDGGPPNNWRSIFGGPAWELDPTTGQYYYHFFLKEQPDLNWRNPAVKKTMWDAVRFWLDMGVDGFRLDAISTIFETPGLPDHQSTASELDVLRLHWESLSPADARRMEVERDKLFEHQTMRPGMHRLMKELRHVVDEYDERVLVGEADEAAFHGEDDDELQMVFNFPLMRTERLSPAWIRANQQERLAALPPGAWPCNTLNNHDTPRLYNRYGDGEHNGEIARLAIALMLTLQGTPFLYNGEEIGMSDFALHDISEFRDTVGVWIYEMLVEQLGWEPEQAVERATMRSRDKCRTPMQWANSANGGFSPEDATPWLPVNPDYAEGVNVADQLADPGSLLHFYRRLLHLRRRTPALVAGDYTPLRANADLHKDADDDVADMIADVIAFTRHDERSGQTCLVALNFSARPHTLPFDLAPTARVLFSSRPREPEQDDLGRLEVGPWEVLISDLIG